MTADVLKHLLLMYSRHALDVFQETNNHNEGFFVSYDVFVSLFRFFRSIIRGVHLRIGLFIAVDRIGSVGLEEGIIYVRYRIVNI
ncbi:hypothetical protein RvY_11405 [Ramazzottius varieornatus]|uniref:Uncharacterized protein n=1 Tax=Ramazzottius varieornatus TaxID=947166 RepID=A0A1D1VLG3_RAMVA|nr:hypothetical protein RvY_11405 [Ramazzottius varieornatus]